MKRRIAILGSTGSIGTQALQIVDRYPDHFEVAALTAHSNKALFLEQIKRYRPEFAGMTDDDAARELKDDIPPGTAVASGEEALDLACALPGLDMALIAVVGIAGLRPLMKCLELGVKAALANKESIVCGGELVNRKLKQTGGTILPVDSEHSAIFQSLLAGGEGNAIRRILLTCSGGAFRDWTKYDLIKATPREALSNPNWNMGAQVTIDSATLMNKGLEVIEAHFLFSLPAERIEVLIHKQSMVHSMVEYEDNAIIAHISEPDMRIPIQYALMYPRRMDCGVPPLDLSKAGLLSFEKPDTERFPCLALAYEALRRGGSAPAVLDAANSAAVKLFLENRIRFMDIPRKIEAAMNAFAGPGPDSIEDIIILHGECRRSVLSGKE